MFPEKTPNNLTGFFMEMTVSLHFTTTHFNPDPFACSLNAYFPQSRLMSCSCLAAAAAEGTAVGLLTQKHEKSIGLL